MKKINRNTTETITVSWPKRLKKDVFRYAQSRDLTVSQATKQIVENFLLREEMEKIQKAFAPTFKKLGIKTYEDVEKFFG